MKLNTEPIKEWFGFSRRERRSSFTLLIVLVFVILLKYLIPGSKTEIINVPVTAGFSDNSTVVKPVASPGEKHNQTGQVRKTSFYATRSSVRFEQKRIIEINSCDSASLVSLPGIGPVLSARIIKYRRLLGGFARTEQLREVYGLSEETYEKIHNMVSCDSVLIKKIDMNRIDFKGLIHFPYFEQYEIKSILKFREVSGKIKSINELIGNKIITKEKALKIGPYLSFSD